MDHVGPDFQRHRDVRTTKRGRETSCISKEGFGRSYLDQRRRKAVQVGVERRNPRILAVRPMWEIGVGQFVEIVLVNKRIDRVLAGERRAGHRQVRPRRYQPRTGGKRFTGAAQRVDERNRKPATGAVAADGDMRGADCLGEHKTPGRECIFERGGKRMLGCQPITDG